MTEKQKTPIELVFEKLVELAENNETNVTLDDMRHYFKEQPSVENKIIACLSNFKRLKILNSVPHAPGLYVIIKDAILPFNDLFKQGKVKLWYNSKGQHKTKTKSPYMPQEKKCPTKSQYHNRFKGSCAKIGKKFPDIPKKFSNSAQFYARAAVACQTDLFSNREITDFCNSNGISIEQKDFSNLMTRQSRLFKRPETFKYIPNKIFWKKFLKEKEYFKIVFPDFSEIIEENFNHQDLENRISKKDSRTVIKAVSIAYKKSLSIADYLGIFEFRRFNISEAKIRDFIRENNEIFKIAHHEGKQTFYDIKVDNFFSFNEENIDHFCNLLPDRANIIKERYHLWKVNQRSDTEDNQSSEKSTQEATDESLQAPSDVESVANEVQLKNEEEITENDAQASPSEDDQEAIDMANVGASIIAYVNQLKKESKLSTQSSEYLQLKGKYENISAVAINARNETQSLQGQIEKLKGIIETQNEKIRELAHKLSVAENKASVVPKVKPIDGTFKMSEVTRITRLIKADKPTDQSSGGQIINIKGS